VAQRILIADDDDDVLEALRVNLEVEGYDVHVAHDGHEALQQARALTPDLVLLDVVMPGPDGVEVCRDIKADARTRDAMVIFLTAKGATRDEAMGLIAGADDYIVKPFDMPELQARIDNLIATRRRLRERFERNGASAGAVAFQLHADPPEVTAADAIYLERVRTAILAHIAEEDFGVAELARAVAQDRSHLYRRIRDLTQETPTALIRRLRIERAAQLLAGRAGSVAEIAYATGFNSVSYFCKCFRDAYGATPSGWRDGQTG
jgi:DNA-binding response OmpR family regulator